MAEYVREGPWKKASPGAMLDDAIIRRDLFYLINLFMADEKITRLNNRISDLQSEFAVQEITFRLAATASFLRARDDYYSDEIERRGTASDRAWANELQAQSCGTLQQDLDVEAIIPLTLREACNKVIHATEYRFDVEGEFGSSYINPVVYLYGSWRRTRWRAVLDVVRYVEVGVSYTDFS